MADIKDVTCVYWDTPVDIGGTCIVGVQFLYKGPATTRKIYAAIGNTGWAGFDEILSAEKDLYIPASYPEDSWSSYTTYVHIPITSAINSADSPYDLYAKVRIAWVGWEVGQTYENIIVVGGGGEPPPPPPDSDYRNFEIVSYSPAQLEYGESLQMRFRIQHIGEAESGRVHTAIGSKDTWFDEILNTDTPVSFSESMDWEWFDMTVNIPITQSISPGSYEFYAVLRGVRGADRYVYSPKDAIAVEGEGGGEVFSGSILSVEPAEIREGTPIALFVRYEPKTKSLVEAINGWWAEVEVTLDTDLATEKSGLLFGKEPGVIVNEVSFDRLMPGFEMSGKVVLKCYKGGFSGYYEAVDSFPFSLQLTGEEPPQCDRDSQCPPGYICENGVCVPESPEPPDPPEDGEESSVNYLGWAVLAAGVVTIGAAVFMDKGKK